MKLGMARLRIGGVVGFRIEAELVGVECRMAAATAMIKTIVASAT